MPDDYYVSQYSGEEIDERLTAAHNAVRYDAAQTLTDAQKTQARKNIAAAPDGFGLGTINRVVTDFDTVKLNGWYYGAAGTAHTPDSANSWSVRVTNLGNSSDVCIQDAYTLINVNRYLHCRRLVYVSTATQNNPWEWVNPPMHLGVEYRTTDRYLDKPVYVQAVNFGTLPNANTKSVTWATSGVVLAVLSAEATSNLGEPLGLGASLSGTEITANKTTLYIKSSGNYADNTAVFRVKYTKTTD